MTRYHRTGHVVAAAALTLLGVGAAVPGPGSASHLDVHADGNLVWSTAWPTTPPQPPEPPSPSPTPPRPPAQVGFDGWVWGFEQATVENLKDGTSTIAAKFDASSQWPKNPDCTFTFVSTIGQASIPCEGTWSLTAVPGKAIASPDTQRLAKAFGTNLPAGVDTPHAFVLEVYLNGTLVARSAPFWWILYNGTAHAAVAEATAW